MQTQLGESKENGILSPGRCSSGQGLQLAREAQTELAPRAPLPLLIAEPSRSGDSSASSFASTLHTPRPWAFHFSCVIDNYRANSAQQTMCVKGLLLLWYGEWRRCPELLLHGQQLCPSLRDFQLFPPQYHVWSRRNREWWKQFGCGHSVKRKNGGRRNRNGNLRGQGLKSSHNSSL